MDKTLLIMSDSHGCDNLILRVQRKEKYDVAIFAGDYTTNIDFMKEHFNYFVDGNNDYGYKDTQDFEIEGIKFSLIHSHTLFSFDKDKFFSNLRSFGIKHHADVVIYGHTHYEDINNENKPILINPGSISLPRSPKGKGSYIIANINNKGISFKIKYL